MVLGEFKYLFILLLFEATLQNLYSYLITKH